MTQSITEKERRSISRYSSQVGAVHPNPYYFFDSAELLQNVESFDDRPIQCEFIVHLDSITRYRLRTSLSQPINPMRCQNLTALIYLLCLWCIHWSIGLASPASSSIACMGFKLLQKSSLSRQPILKICYSWLDIILCIRTIPQFQFDSRKQYLEGGVLLQRDCTFNAVLPFMCPLSGTNWSRNTETKELYKGFWTTLCWQSIWCTWIVVPTKDSPH